MALGSTVFLMQEADTSGTILIGARNGFNNMSRLEMLCTVRHRCPMGVRFAFNSYKHWEQLLLHHREELPVMLLIQEGVTQVYPLSIFLYCITIISLVEELQAADPGLITPFYSDDAEFNRLALSSAQLLNMLMERGTDWGVFSLAVQ